MIITHKTNVLKLGPDRLAWLGERHCCNLLGLAWGRTTILKCETADAFFPLTFDSSIIISNPPPNHISVY
ncbi:hypothetical protein L1987_22773 [Smallanthus sonchifolius]|uniref:Uncharacterized protein n=1 Tax=Smallanthus sonchifolius TaxID=185202 RepID=A0ACB9IFL5_9ASTR|nr:hypothetical protein L1987_22773 [Smallanthus sonchifolius]